MVTGPPASVLDALDLRPRPVTVLKDAPGENANWLARTSSGQRVVLRRYHAGATPGDLSYEHAVLRHMTGAGWVVPEPLSELVPCDGLWYALTRFVPGSAIDRETGPQQARRGCDLARLDLALRHLGATIGQRPGWRAQHQDVSVHNDIDWRSGAAALLAENPRLGSWACSAAERTRAGLAVIGAGDLPVTVVHGDFAEWNVHYSRGGLAGVVDFGLTHLDSRPYELAIARTYRAAEAIAAYRAELAARGWPLSELEECAIEPVYQAFRGDMAAWAIEQGRRTGRFDLAMIERQLARTGTPPP